MRKARVFCECTDPKHDVIRKACENVLSMSLGAELVVDKLAADLLVFIGWTRDFVNWQRPVTTPTIFFNVNMKPSSKIERDGVLETDVFDLLPNLSKALGELKLDGDAPEMSPLKTENGTRLQSEEKPGRPWVLVVDDKDLHRESARRQLTDVNLVMAVGFDQAREELSKRNFDYALLDLHLMVSTNGALGSDALGKYYGQEIPYGIFLLLEACRKGAQAAVVTDLNHHQDPLSAVFDIYHGQHLNIEGKKALLLHAEITDDGSKNWRKALEQLRQT